MSILRFNGEDRRDLLEVFVEAVAVTEATGEKPSIEIGERLFAGYELVVAAQMLPDEPLRNRHTERLSGHFDQIPRSYRQAGYKLAHRMNNIVADNTRLREMLISH